MLHIDDWLDDPATGPADVKEWLEHFRRPAIDKDHAWLRARQLFCTYKDGKRYRCIGCSRMGDVWLTANFDRENGYDLRIDIADCTDWEVVSNADAEGGALRVLGGGRTHLHRARRGRLRKFWKVSMAKKKE